MFDNRKLLKIDENTFYFMLKALFILKDTHREKAPSNETPVLTKSRNIGTWVVARFGIICTI